MFKVKLIDIGYDSQFVEFDTSLETLAEVEHFVQAGISTVLCRNDIVIVHDDELVYEVYAGGRSAGFVAIESL